MRAANRQLALPHVARKPEPPPARARRDLQASEFARALERLGFRQISPTRFIDTAGPHWRYIEAAVVRGHGLGPFRINRRATLARLLRARNANA